ncbi:hypothetical protein V8G54_029687 [Vigna mungo]|uniref:Gnk2-homologous domain-containing protein n=1 Tax=Vigna mungo TaxID=3915 RepID=A0AAQ3MUZ7_VIGMU
MIIRKASVKVVGCSDYVMGAVSCMLLFFLCCLIPEASGQDVLQTCDNNNGNYTANSTYSTNLNTLLSTLSSNTEINYGFYNFSHGQNADRVNAIGLCRGDVEPNQCRSCLKDAGGNITQLCPNQKQATIYYENCMLRYSNGSIFGILDSNPDFYMWNQNNATEAAEFNQVLQNLLRELKDKAASGDSRRKYATDNDTTTNFQAIYGLVQCTPDLTQTQCNDCLDVAISQIPICCNDKRGGRVLGPSCNIRYEDYRFYG